MTKYYGIVQFLCLGLSMLVPSLGIGLRGGLGERLVTPPSKGSCVHRNKESTYRQLGLKRELVFSSRIYYAV